MNRIYNFDERLHFSKGTKQKSDEETIMKMLDGCVRVDPATVVLDKIGVDYIATLRRGAEVYVDAKTRSLGCSKYWKNGPELAIEEWSVLPENGRAGKIGWTLDEAKVTDLILYVWDSSDTDAAFLIGFQSLRVAARRNITEWKMRYKVDTQNSGSWKSRAVFVPWMVLMGAVNKAQIFTPPATGGL